MLLAFMSPPASIHHMPMANTMSVAILPSTVHTSSHRHSPVLPKRPKLSLNTADIPSTIGKKSTSLRLDTLSTTSPTSRNTFSNAIFDSPGFSGLRTQGSPLEDSATDIQHDRDRQPSPTDTATSNDSVSSASSIDLNSGEPPYCLSHNVCSILRNGPIPRNYPQKTSFAQSKPMMFPAPKKVSFRTPLEEEVKNKQYTMRNIDIESSTSTISTLELSPQKEEGAQPCDSATEDDQKPDKNVIVTNKPLSKSQTGKRESSDEEDSDTPAATPVAGRRKRSRHWTWTLPQVPTVGEKTTQSDSNVVDGTKTS